MSAERPTVRQACRRRMPLDGTDAQALEHALTITERERDEARAEVGRLRSAADTFAAGLVWGAAIVAMAVAIRDAHPEPLRFTSRRERWPDDFGPCD